LHHGCQHIVPCTKSHIGKEDQVQFIDGRLTLLFSSAARMFHTTANVTSRKSDSGYKLSKTYLEHLHYFHTWSCLLPSKHKRSFKEFPKNEDAKTLKQHQQFFLECIILVIVDDINVKVISITCIVFFGDLMDGLWSTFSPTNTACIMTASNKSSNTQ
jgi:hypothetical protein